MIILMLLLWLYRFVTPVVFLFGGIVLCSGEYGENDLWIGGILAVIGFFFGLFTWGLGVVPKLLWIKSPFELFQSRVWTAIDSALVFFLIPSFITGVEMLIDGM